MREVDRYRRSGILMKREIQQVTAMAEADSNQDDDYDLATAPSLSTTAAYDKRSFLEKGGQGCNKSKKTGASCGAERGHR